MASESSAASATLCHFSTLTKITVDVGDPKPEAFGKSSTAALVAMTRGVPFSLGTTKSMLSPTRTALAIAADRNVTGTATKPSTNPATISSGPAGGSRRGH